MKIGIQTWGSHGDIRPFIALAEGMQNAGHDVTLVVTCVDNNAYANSKLNSGVKLVSVASPVFTDREELTRKSVHIFKQKNPIRQIQLMIEDYFIPVEKEMFTASMRLCAENELVIGHFFHYPLNIAATLNQKNYVSVSLVHSVVPSSYNPPAGMPNLGKLGNSLIWKLASGIMDHSIKKYADNLRLSNGLPKALGLLKEVWASKQLNIVAVSPQICRRQPDWPENYQVSGFLTKSDISLEGKISAELEEFITSGEAPVFMTFGSIMSGEDLQETFDIFIEAAKLAKVRAIIQSPNWEKYDLRPSQQIHFTGYTPHASVFPRCSAIVHHGGAGTTQANLLSGKPAIIIPHTAEQEFWGREVKRIGVAFNYLKRRQLKAKHLAQAINMTLAHQKIIATAAVISQNMANEDGVATAVSMINERFTG